MIENRRTTVNGRIIVGGCGRKHPKEADVFLRLALRVSKDVRYVEPQFTLRITKDMPEDIFDMAMESLGAGATYPTLYNDDVNVPAVARAMRVDMETAEQYVPLRLRRVCHRRAEHGYAQHLHKPAKAPDHSPERGRGPHGRHQKERPRAR